MIRMTAELRAALEAQGVSIPRGVPHNIPQDCEFEPPCSLKWMEIAYKLRMGAFSYAVSGYYFGAIIGRYTSIGEAVQVGRGSHPVSWASTSPLFYQPYRNVTDLDVPAAHAFRTAAPYQAPRTTLIGNDVYIGHGAFIMQGVTIGDGAIIGAMSVVTKDVPPYAVVAGSPARIKSFRFADEMIACMRRVAWWDYAFWDMNGIPVADPQAFLDFVQRRIADGMQPYKPAIISLATPVPGAASPQAVSSQTPAD
jgi:virginiamycin A acetyltransferase